MTAADYLQYYQGLAGSLPGQHLGWLQARRQAAGALFAAGGFPSPRAEEWRYTNVSPIERKLFKPALAAAEAVGFPKWAESFRLADAWSLVLVDGQFQVSASRLEGLPDGVTVLSMAEALSKTPERLEALLGSALSGELHGFIAMNTAFFSDGVFIDLPRGVVLERPLQILHIATSPEMLANTRSVVCLGASAQGYLVETFAGAAGLGYLSNAVTEIVLEEGARLEHCKLQCESARAYHFGGVYVSQQRDARFVQHNLAFGGLLARNEIHAALGQGAECEMNGLFLTRERQHVDNHTLIDHREPRGVSRETYRGVLSERSRGVFQGRIIVQPDAQKTQAEMNNRNLLLSDDAEIDTKPQLEILADDVKCAHGVTVGQLAAESVFYLVSRGIDRESARNMLTFAFANEMVEKIPLPGLKVQVQEQLLNLFPQSGIRRDWL
ncbi:Fe-S cluster assembly protein SufD [Methyloterricola oryzae]|uniref:Fe-S cluster assembly protein SufD n=1 Tax=Methyloterricola oryzae TaxID=1495050 RepID=UPI0005EB9519|nr:Fe-S cluster assembly protein SufD [Methyloterricola oryzae]